METKPVSLETKIIAGAVAAVVLFAGSLLAVRHELMNEMTQESAHQQEADDRLTHRLGEVEAQLSTLAAQPKPDMAAFEAAQNDLKSAQATIAQLNDRMTLLEKKPLPIPQAPTSAALIVPVSNEAALRQAVESGMTYQTQLDAWEKDHAGADTKLLHQSAATGLTTEEALRRQLDAVIDRMNTGSAAADSSSLISRINLHLAGLVSIKKQSTVAPEIATLREESKTAPLTALVADIQRLPAASQAPFSGWLQSVNMRQATLAELNAQPVKAAQ